MANGRSLRVLGLDPGFANVGFAIYRVEPAADGRSDQHVVERAGLIWTEKSDKKRKVLAADDNTRRTREMTRALTHLICNHTMVNNASIGVHAICAEAMSFPRNSSTAAKMALTWGAIIALAENFHVPIVQASPQEIKLALCKRKDASKEDIRAAVESKLGTGLAREMVDQHGAKLTAKADFEHPFDAIASVMTCLDSEVLRMARSMAA